MIDTIAHIALLVLLPPLLLGTIDKTKARFAGRVGAPLLQPYFDILKLARKGLVLSATTTWAFRMGPVITLVAVAAAGLLVPFGGSGAPIGFSGDLILFAYLFGLARFFTTTAALDTGSAFEGMGASREAAFSCLTEPALFCAFLVLARLSGSLSLGEMLPVPSGWSFSGAAAPLILISLGLVVILLAEACRIPVDDPNTHLELTMIHEAMILDHGGPLLGMILYSSSMKLFVLGAVLMSVIAPFHTGTACLDWALFVGEMLALAVAIGALESLTARLKMRRVPYLLVSAILFCGSGFVLLVR